MYVNASRKPSFHLSDSTSAFVGLSLLLYISLYSCQCPASSSRYKRRNEGCRGCTIYLFLCKQQETLFGFCYQNTTSKGSKGSKQETFRWIPPSTGPRPIPLLPMCTIDASVLKRGCWEFGASNVAAYIVAAWLAAGGESGKREVCRGRGTRLKLTDAAKHPSEVWSSCKPSRRALPQLD